MLSFYLQNLKRGVFTMFSTITSFFYRPHVDCSTKKYRQVPSATHPLLAKVHSVALFIFKFTLSALFLYLHPYIFFCGVCAGAFLPKYAHKVAKVVNNFYNVQRSFFEKCLIIGGGALFAAYTYPLSSMAASFYCSGKIGLFIREDSKARQPATLSST